MQDQSPVGPCAAVRAILRPRFVTPAPLPPPMINIRALDHVVLRVIDIEAMRRFYCTIRKAAWSS
ncbi:MAG TPA: hypothetical protein VFG55_07895 [Rhodanobacteraceae bacterium]|nr:hypothetical protein [Rhodanobacteraceae bacterium]